MKHRLILGYISMRSQTNQYILWLVRLVGCFSLSKCISVYLFGEIKVRSGTDIEFICRKNCISFYILQALMLIVYKLLNLDKLSKKVSSPPFLFISFVMEEF